MKNKQYHKTSKAVARKPKNTVNNKVKKSDSNERSSFLEKIILLLYLGVGFLSPMAAYDVAITQWLYVAFLNILVLVFLIVNKKRYDFSFGNKITKFVFIGSVAFFIIACLSFVKSISISESIVYTSFVVNSLTAFYVLYFIIKGKTKEYFEFVAYVLMIILAIESFQVIHHFLIKNGTQPRSNEIFSGLNPTYGNRNILAASLAVKMSFVFYILFDSKKTLIKVISYASIFLAIFSILLVGARTAIYSLPIILSVLSVGYFLIKDEKMEVSKYVKNFILPLLLVCGLGFLAAISSNKIHKGSLNSFNDLIFAKKKEALYRVKKVSNNSAKVKPLASDSGRGFFWNSAIDAFKENPFLGVGIGNWKMIKKDELIKSNKTNSYYNPRRVHNDFLQVLSELGIFGFLLYLTFFGLIYFLLIKNFFDKSKEKEKRFIALVCLSAFIAFTLDSLINFPFERTPIVITGFFIAIFSLLTNNVVKFNYKVSEYLNVIILVITVIAIYFNNRMFEASKHHLKMRHSINNTNFLTAKYKLKYDDINNELSGFPLLNMSGQPVDYSKAVLAYSEGKYHQALGHLDRSIQISPNYLGHYGFKALIYGTNKVLKNSDSTFYYARKTFDAKPSVINPYIMLKRHYVVKKDTLAYLNLINKHLKNLPKASHPWQDKAIFYLDYYKDKKKAQEVIDSAKMMNPYDKKIQGFEISNIKSAKKKGTSSVKNKLKEYVDLGAKLFKEKKYNEAYKQFEEAQKLDKNNMDILMSMATIDTQLKRYINAINKYTKVINSGKVTSGKPEYHRGRIHLITGNQTQAGMDFRNSYDKGYSLAKKLDKVYLDLK